MVFLTVAWDFPPETESHISKIVELSPLWALTGPVSWIKSVTTWLLLGPNSFLQLLNSFLQLVNSFLQLLNWFLQLLQVYASPGVKITGLPPSTDDRLLWTVGRKDIPLTQLEGCNWENSPQCSTDDSMESREFQLYDLYVNCQMCIRLGVQTCALGVQQHVPDVWWRRNQLNPSLVQNTFGQLVVGIFSQPNNAEFCWDSEQLYNFH